MQKSLLNQIKNTIKVITLALILSVGVSYALAQWTGPSTLPPPDPSSVNTPAPINVSSDSQSKVGNFDVQSTLSAINAIFTGTVGIGDATPDSGLLLDVEGKVGATDYCDQNGSNCTAASALGGSGSDGIGVGQTWQDMTSVRSLGATNIYQNNTGKPIFVNVTVYGTNNFNFQAWVGPTSPPAIYAGGGILANEIGNFTVSLIVPDGDFYYVKSGGFAVLNNWAELR